MKVTDDTFNLGLMNCPVFGRTFILDMAEKICAGRGTKCERQQYTREEREWAAHVLGKPIDHSTGEVIRWGTL
ncbi:hypothetical protein LCGC14_0142160 [marine sediment metagenome]|uniref:Uncharacterized protein n=1 Tax=marine sediment metagenome TaxID=412755 RepID=A0A0F9XIF2_9ZZZZ